MIIEGKKLFKGVFLDVDTLASNGKYYAVHKPKSCKWCQKPFTFEVSNYSQKVCSVRCAVDMIMDRNEKINVHNM